MEIVCINDKGELRKENLPANRNVSEYERMYVYRYFTLEVSNAFILDSDKNIASMEQEDSGIQTKAITNTDLSHNMCKIAIRQMVDGECVPLHVYMSLESARFLGLDIGLDLCGCILLYPKR